MNLLRAFKVFNPGIQTTVQDLGRPGLLKYGIPPSGAMDQSSFLIANLLVGNPENAASLEITLHGLKLQTMARIIVAITGADLDPRVNNQPAPQWTSFTLEKGDILHFKARKRGFRAYFAVQGGFEAPEVLGSRSTFIRGGIGATLRKEETLCIRASNSKSPLSARCLPCRYRYDFNRNDHVRVLDGPQLDHFTEQAVVTFLDSVYRITPQSDRQACRTEGPAIEVGKEPGIITDPIPLGSVQVPGDGKPIILLRDAQVTGGYAKIAVAATADMDRLGQMMPGDSVRFQRITRQEALELLYEHKHRLSVLKALLA